MFSPKKRNIKGEKYMNFSDTWILRYMDTL